MERRKLTAGECHIAMAHIRQIVATVKAAQREAVEKLAQQLLEDGDTKVFFKDLIAIGGTEDCTRKEMASLGITGDPGITLLQLHKTHPLVAIEAAHRLAAERMPDYQPPSQSVRQRRLADCKHLSKPTGEKVECKTCRGKVELLVIGCTVHGKCTPGRMVPGVVCCRFCQEFEEKS
jgi:hypothetical protein